jgi:Fic-DOC domain mobile mystery protein B
MKMDETGEVGHGSTPIDPEELDDLIPDLSTQEDLNEWERENILEARTWALGERQIKHNDPLSEPYIRELHRRMFNHTWKWAGTYRKTEKTIGVLSHEIRNRLPVLLGNARYWIDRKTYDVDEIAVRTHHEMVVIHPFPKGNGRHARLLADVIAVKLDRPAFTWGQKEIVAAGPVRNAYLDALRAADNGNVQDLLRFARS